MPIYPSDYKPHSGFTTDLHMIVTKLANQYDEIYLIGYSLGGNMNLKYTTINISITSSKRSMPK